jgi:hypothetical protein
MSQSAAMGAKRRQAKKSTFITGMVGESHKNLAPIRTDSIFVNNWGSFQIPSTL